MMITDDLEEKALAYDPQDIRRMYCVRMTNPAWNASFAPRAYLYWNDNYGEAGSWLNFGIGV